MLPAYAALALLALASPLWAAEGAPSPSAVTELPAPAGVPVDDLPRAGAPAEPPRATPDPGASAGKSPVPPPAAEPATARPRLAFSEAVCPLIEAAAAAQDLPAEFFARLIWRESSFNPRAVSSAGAMGVAQFMPPTAAWRGLADPFDPEQAIPASAAYLRELRDQFGNLGLAAAAYNGGSGRVAEWLAGRGGLPSETVAYVRAITGRSPEDWAARAEDLPVSGVAEGLSNRTGCRQLAVYAARRVGATAETAAPAVPKAAPAPKKTGGPWGVQLAGDFSQGDALSAYADLQRRYRAILGGLDPMVVSSRFRSRGTRTFYRVRVAANTRQRADELCTSLRAAGAACIVLKN